MKQLLTFVILTLAMNSYADSISVMSFNTGTTPNMGSSKAGPNEFSKEDAKVTDEYYGNGLSWNRALRATKKFISNVKPDIIGFEEIFDPLTCKKIPKKYHKGFVCESWNGSQGFVTQQVTSGEYQIACHLNDNEKCIAVKKSFGSIEGCHSNVCLNFLDGSFIENCGKRSRIGRAKITKKNGEKFNVVHIHGTSGFSTEDKDCRRKQFRKAFFDYSDGVNNIVFGDFNTDPSRMKYFDKSARKLKKFANETKFSRVSKTVKKKTYGGFVTLDHVYSDKLRGKCVAFGATDGLPPVLNTSYFDHMPLYCRLSNSKH